MAHRQIISLTYLCNRVSALKDRKNGFLLDWGWLFESISVDSSEHFFVEIQVFELVNAFVPVGLKNSLGDFFLLLVLENIGLFFLDKVTKNICKY